MKPYSVNNKHYLYYLFNSNFVSNNQDLKAILEECYLNSQLLLTDVDFDNSKNFVNMNPFKGKEIPPQLRIVIILNL